MHGVKCVGVLWACMQISRNERSNAKVIRGLRISKYSCISSHRYVWGTSIPSMPDDLYSQVEGSSTSLSCTFVGHITMLAS